MRRRRRAAWTLGLALLLGVAALGIHAGVAGGSLAAPNGSVEASGTYGVSTARAAPGSLSITSAAAVDLADGDGVVGDGDRVAVSAVVSPGAAAVDTVVANASPFGAGSVTLADGDGDGVYDAVFTVDAGSASGSGSYTIGITAADTAGGEASAATNELTLEAAAPVTAAPGQPGFGALAATIAVLAAALAAARRRR